MKPCAYCGKLVPRSGPRWYYCDDLCRFMCKVQKTDDCWLWTGAIHPGTGYGLFAFHGSSLNAHRVGYILMVGEVPDGLGLDHTCHTGACFPGRDCPHRRCVNPAHLEPVTDAENQRRSPFTTVNATHCPHGHEYTEANTFRWSAGARRCRACEEARYQRRVRV